MWRNLNPHTLLVGKKSSAATVENSLAVLQKIKHRVKIWPNKPTPSYIHKGNESICPYRNLYANGHSSANYNSQKVETIQISIKWWMDKYNKMWYIHIMKYYLVIKRNEVLTDVIAWMNLENIMLSDKSQKITYCMIPFIRYFHNSQIYTDRSRLVVA